MEQRIGPSTPPVPAAGFDPAYIPGITAPRPDEPKEVAEPSREDPVPDEAAVAVEAAGAAEDERAEAADTAEEDTAAEDVESAEAGDEREEEDEADGPAFEASDHRGSISAGRRGVTLTLDGETAEFNWDEIGAVEIDTPRFGRRFSVTVYTSARRWYSADIAASSKKVLKAWTAGLDEVLDIYFEDAKPEDANPENAKPEDVKSEEAEPEDAKSEKAEPEDATSEKTGPKDATS